MIYFSLADIARALVLSSLLGIIMGGIYKSLSTIISCLAKLFGVGIAVMRADSIKRCKDRCVIHTRNVGPLINVYDFIFFVLCGAIYIAMCYITLDGIHRVYVLIPSIITFLASKNTLGSIFERIIRLMHVLIYCTLFCIIYVLTYPLRIVWRGTKALFSPPIKRISKYIDKSKSVALTKKAAKQIKSFFKSAPTI